MNGLESEKNPLRLSKHFYQPYHPPASRMNRKNYPSMYRKNSPILDVPEPPSIIGYVGEIQKVRPIHRQFGHMEIYYPDKEKNMKRVENMYNTISTRRKSVSSFLKPIHHRSIEQERDEFLKTFRAKSNAKQEHNLTFYNTARKSKYIMGKFYEDTHINERSSPTFQNMLNRIIVMDDVLDKARSNDRKFVKGF